MALANGWLVLVAVAVVIVAIAVGLVIGLESLGIPLPGEIILVTAAVMSSRHTLDIDPMAVGLSAAAGAIIGDSIGYSIGRRFGMTLFERLDAQQLPYYLCLMKHLAAQGIPVPAPVADPAVEPDAGHPLARSPDRRCAK